MKVAIVGASGAVGQECCCSDLQEVPDENTLFAEKKSK